ncbi:MAG: flagellar basal-body MS-ring/collar protein FliF [Porticoccaceae bacterium]
MATTVAKPTDLATTEAAVDSMQTPVSQTPALPTQQADGGSNTRAKLPSPREILRQPAVRRSMPAIIALLSVAIFVIVYLWVQQPPYRSLYPGLSEVDRQAAYEALNTEGFEAQIDPQTGALKVPDGKYHEARIYLASQGLPRGGAAAGIESLNSDTSMTTSQFMEQVRYISAMEQELALSIAQIATVQSARVHLASPKQSVFVRNRTQATASVVVNPRPGRVISPSQVEAIVHLVASSTPYLAAEDVVVVDQRGKLLTDANSFGSMQLSSAQITYRQRLEETYRNRIAAILVPVLGEGNVRSEVDLQIDFTQVESTFEEYDGNNSGPKARSEVLMVERGSNRSAGGVPGATSNTPPAEDLMVIEGQLSTNADTQGTGSFSNKTTRNYEIDRAIRHVKHQGGKLERVSVAVLINELMAAPSDPQAEDQPEDQRARTDAGFSEMEIQRFTDLVKSVVGYDAERGDVITLVSAKFEEPILVETTEPWYENQQIISGVKSLTAVLTFILLLFVVVRPVIRAYLPESTELQEEESAVIKDGELTQEELNMIELGDDESLEDIKAKLKPKKSTISADMLDTANTYDDKVALVRLLVAEDSGRVANVLKKMIKPI